MLNGLHQINAVRNSLLQNGRGSTRSHSAHLVTVLYSLLKTDASRGQGFPDCGCHIMRGHGMEFCAQIRVASSWCTVPEKIWAAFAVSDDSNISVAIADADTFLIGGVPGAVLNSLLRIVLRTS